MPCASSSAMTAIRCRRKAISHIAAIKKAAYESLKGTPLEGSKIYLAGTASIYKDLSDGNDYDLLIPESLHCA